MEPATLVRLTTIWDVHEGEDTQAFSPMLLEGHTPEDTGNDDGLFQRYGMSCGPSSIEVLRGNLDPAYALQLNLRGLTVNPTAPADFQRKILVDYGENVQSRIVPYHAKEVGAAIDALGTRGVLTAQEQASLRSYLIDGAKPSTGSDAALTKARKNLDGYPNDAVVRTLREFERPDSTADYHRIGLKNIERIYNEVVGADAGAEVELVSMYAEGKVKPGTLRARSKAFVEANMDRLVSALSDETGVLFSTTYPDHFWTFQDTRVQDGARELLVHDTWTGKTVWVTEAQLLDGTFAESFPPSNPKTAIDLIYLPK